MNKGNLVLLIGLLELCLHLVHAQDKKREESMYLYNGTKIELTISSICFTCGIDCGLKNQSVLVNLELKECNEQILATKLFYNFTSLVGLKLSELKYESIEKNAFEKLSKLNPAKKSFAQPKLILLSMIQTKKSMTHT